MTALDSHATGHTMGVGTIILNRLGHLSIVWSENGPCRGTIAYFIHGKRRATLRHLFHMFVYFYSYFFKGFALMRKERRAWWIILTKRGGLLLCWLYIGVCTWLCNVCLICKSWHPMENGRVPWFLAFALRLWIWAIEVCGHLREM